MVGDARVLLGYVVRAHGIRGALRVRPLSERAEETAQTLAAGPALFLDEQRYPIVRVRLERDELLVELEGVHDRTGAEALQGRQVFVDRAQLPAIAGDEVYLADLVGCEVVDRSGKPLGRVTGSLHTGAHETLILDAAGRELLLPFVSVYLVEVDVAARRIVYDPPPGLVDLDDAERG